MDAAVTQRSLFSCTGVGEFELGDGIGEFFRSFDRPVLSVFDTKCGGLYISTDPCQAQTSIWYEVCDRRIIGDAIAVSIKWFRNLDDMRRVQIASGPRSDGDELPNGWQIQEIPHDSPEHRWARITPAWVPARA